MKPAATLAVLGAFLLHQTLGDDSCWTSGDWISPRSNAETCGQGLYAFKSGGITTCGASWRDYAGNEQQKECMPNPDDCKALADAIAKDTHKDEHLVIKWETGSGKNTPLAIWSANEDINCYKLHTAHETCRFNFYVDAVPGETAKKNWRIPRGDLASGIRASAAYFPGSDSNAPNNELELRLFDGTYLSDDGQTYSSTGMNDVVKARAWLDPAHASCKDKCGKIDGYCY